MEAILCGKSQTLPGYILGRWEPSVFVRFQSSLTDIDLNSLLAHVAAIFPEWESLKRHENFDETAADLKSINAQRMGDFSTALTQSLGFAANEKVLLVPNVAHSTWQQLLLPTPINRPDLSGHLWKITIDIINNFARTHDVAETRRFADALLLKYQSNQKLSINLRLINAAHQNRIPVIPISETILQFGHGSNSKWLLSSFTENTSAVTANLSKDKFYCAARLRSVGLPAPEHFKIFNIEQACAAAAKIGYPVVLKPTRMEQGQGVVAGIENESELKSAYEKVGQLSKEFLVEKHIDGRDYRLTVFNRALIWAVERVPAGVFGDGVNTITSLVKFANADARRGDKPDSKLKSLVLDDEACSLIAKQGLTPDSVPEKDTFVPFRSIANVAAGGFPVPVYDQVHPDNAKLAVDVAEALRLDLAGIDLLIPDIRVSWKNSVAGICEVNAQPNLGTITGQHIYAEILKKYLDNQYGIPIVLIFGAENPDEIVQDIANVLMSDALQIATYNNQVLKINNVVQEVQSPNFWKCARSLLTNRSVDICIMALNDDSFIDLGFPFEYFDVGIIAGRNVKTNTDQRSFELILNVFMQSAPHMVKSKLFAIKPYLDTPDHSIETLKNIMHESVSVTSFDEILDEIKKMTSNAIQ